MQGVGCRVQGVGCRVQGVGCRVQGVGCRVQGAGCRVYGLPEEEAEAEGQRNVRLTLPTARFR